MTTTTTTTSTQISGVYTMTLLQWDEVAQKTLAQQADLDKANNIISNSEVKLANAEKSLQQLKLTSAKTIKELRTKSNRLEVIVNEGKAKLDALTSQCNVDVETTKALQDRVKVLELRRRSDTASITMLKSQLSDKDQYLERVTNSDDEIERLRSDLKKCRTQLHAKTTQLQQSKVTHDELKSNHETLKNSTSKSHKDTLALQKTRSDLLNTRVVLRDAEETNTTLRAENTRHLQHIVTLNSKIVALEKLEKDKLRRTALEKEKLRRTALENDNFRRTTVKRDTEALKKQHADARARNQHQRAGIDFDVEDENYTDDDNDRHHHDTNDRHHQNGKRHRHHNQHVESDHNDYDHNDQHHRNQNNDQHHRNQRHHNQLHHNQRHLNERHTNERHGNERHGNEHHHTQQHNHITHTQHQHHGVLGDRDHEPPDHHSQRHNNLTYEVVHKHTNAYESDDIARDFNVYTSSSSRQQHPIAFDTSSQISIAQTHAHTHATDNVYEDVQDILNLTDVELQDLLNQD